MANVTTTTPTPPSPSPSPSPPPPPPPLTGTTTTTTPVTVLTPATNDTATQTGVGIKSSYPPPLATYEEVVSDARLFMETLEGFHKSMGTKFMVPTIGGKNLDLHRLFVEVTSRGGLEKVIGDRKWRDIIAAFCFPSTITSASFVLRKYYISLLQPYEHAYYFRNKDSKNLVADSSSTEVQTQFTVTAPVKGNHVPEHSPGSLVTGKINGKFDHGYLVTVNFGSEILRGVLYHVPLQTSEPPKSSSFIVQRSDRKRSRRAMKDPSRPKSHRSGYNFFFAEQCVKLKPLYSREERAIKIGDMWNKLNADEKEVYQQKGVKDVERYRSEMEEYKKSSNPS